MANGYFITFEGGEGAGKSTQLKILAAKISTLGFDVVTTREPGGSPNAEEIRDLLVNGAPERWSANAETLLNYAARESHLSQTIRPALGQGKIIICDRFFDSTRAYQGAAGGASSTLISTLENKIVGDTVPDLTLVFDIDPERGLARTNQRVKAATGASEDRYENKGLAFHKTLRSAFLKLVQTEPDRCKLIDANQSVTVVSEAVWREIEPKLPKP